ncbi:MAG: M28 family peptidase [Solirubrobacteraceae bacterium]
MPAADTATRLSEFARRGAGTNSERLAAAWLRDETESTRREATLETFWCRPSWALAHAWHSLLAVAGSLVIVSDAWVGGALVLVSLLSILADGLTGHSLGRRLTPERASQNVVSRPIPLTVDSPDGAAPVERVRLIVTANYDAGRAGLAYRGALRRAAAGARRLGNDGRITPGWLGWLAIEHVWLLVVALLRDGGAAGAAIGVLQLIPTVALVLDLALLLELASADFGPAASDNAAGAAVALALVHALDAAPPRRLAVELLLQGAGDGQMIGLSRHLRGRRRELDRRNALVLGIGPCGAGRPHWWTGDGPMVPLRFHRRLGDLAAGLAADGLDAGPHRGRGSSPALPARTAGIPAIGLGCLDERELAPRSHQAGDLPEALEPAAIDALLQFALMLVDALDADLAQTHPAAGAGASVARVSTVTATLDSPPDE